MAQRYKVTSHNCSKDDDGAWIMASHHVAESHELREEITRLKESHDSLKESLASTKEALKTALKLCDYTY